MTTVLLAVTPQTAFNWILKGLAVLGGAVAGAILAGILTWGLCKIVGARPLPTSLRWFVRLLGAGGGGYLAFHLVGGIGGFGFGGGDGSDGNNGENENDDKTTDVRPSDNKPTDKDPIITPPDARTIRVEVLGYDTIKAIQRTEKVDTSRLFRIEGDPKKELMDLKNLQQRLRDERKRSSRLLVRLVIYLNSPPEEDPDVVPLARWLRQEKLFIDPDKPARNAEP